MGAALGALLQIMMWFLPSGTLQWYIISVQGYTAVQWYLAAVPPGGTAPHEFLTSCMTRHDTIFLNSYSYRCTYSGFRGSGFSSTPIDES